MVARTLKLNEIVYVVDEWALDVIKGKITAIDFIQKDMHFSGDELNVDVEVEVTEVLSEPCDVGVKEHIHVSNQKIYQIVPDKHYHGDEVCYECNPDEDRGDYYAPITNDSIDEAFLDENQTENNSATALSHSPSEPGKKRDSRCLIVNTTTYRLPKAISSAS